MLPEQEEVAARARLSADTADTADTTDTTTNTLAAGGTANACPFKTILLKGLKKSFLHTRPGSSSKGAQHELLRTLVAFGEATASPIPVNCIIFFRSRKALLEFGSVSEAEQMLVQLRNAPLVLDGNPTHPTPGHMPVSHKLLFSEGPKHRRLWKPRLESRTCIRKKLKYLI